MIQKVTKGAITNCFVNIYI